MERLIVLVSLCVLGFMPSLVATADSSEFARNGFYVGAGGIYTIEDISGSVSFDNSAGFNIRGGYRFHPHFALEGEIERVLGFDTQNNFGSLDTWTGTVNTKAFVLTGQVQPYGLIGIGVMHGHTDKSLRFIGSNGRPSTSETDVAFRFGGGADVYITNNWVATLESTYVAGRGDINAVDYISVGAGIQYRF